VFKDQYAARAGIEGTISHGTRACDLRHARYTGLAKTHLQQVFTAAAINVTRLVAWVRETPLAATRTSPFARLQNAARPRFFDASFANSIEKVAHPRQEARQVLDKDGK